MALQWSSVYSVGIAALDDDHRTLVAGINRIERDIVVGENLAPSLADFRDRMNDHAGREICVLTRYRYEGCHDMADAHARLAYLLEEFTGLPQAAGVGSRLKLWLAYQDRWLRTLSTTAMGYRRYFESGRISPKVCEHWRLGLAGQRGRTDGPGAETCSAMIDCATRKGCAAHALCSERVVAHLLGAG